MQKKKISNKIFFLFLDDLTFFLYWYGKEIANYFDIKWLVKYPKHYSFPFAIYTTTFVKWLINEANFLVFTFNDLTRFFAWIIEQPYKIVLAIFSKGILRGQGQDAIQIIEPLRWISVCASDFITLLSNMQSSRTSKALGLC